MRATPQEVTGGAHLSGIHIGLWEHATAEQRRNLVGIDFVIFRFTAVDGFHVEGMPQDKGNAFFSTEVSEPVPGEDTLNRDNQAVTVGGNSLEKRFRRGFHVAVQHDFPLVTQDTDVHASGMQIDTTVKWVLIGVEAHEVSSFLGNLHFPLPAYHWGMPRRRPQSLSRAWSRRGTPRGSGPACVPGMRSCLGVKVPRPGLRGAEGPGKRQGVTARWGLKAAWHEGAGRGTRTGDEGWYARDEWARDHNVLPPQLGRTLEIRRLCTEGLTADRGRSAGCPGRGLRAEQSALTAPQKSADGIGPPAKVGRPERWRGVVA